MFTVYTPTGYPHSRLAFATTVTNTGDFDASTGTFTCSQPGNYFFSVTLVKNASERVDEVICHLYKNGGHLVPIFSNPSAASHGGDFGYDSASNSAIVHLNRGDIVYLSYCSPVSSMYGYSSFTGFLVKPDN